MSFLRIQLAISSKSCSTQETILSPMSDSGSPYLSRKSWHNASMANRKDDDQKHTKAPSLRLQKVLRKLRLPETTIGANRQRNGHAALDVGKPSLVARGKCSCSRRRLMNAASPSCLWEPRRLTDYRARGVLRQNPLASLSLKSPLQKLAHIKTLHSQDAPCPQNHRHVG